MRCFIKLLFLPIDIHHTQCPYRLVILERDKSSEVANFETDICIAKCLKQDTRCIRYTHACGVWAVFLEHGRGTLGITKIVGLHLPSIVNLCPLHIILLYFSFLSESGGRRRSALYLH